MTPKENLEQEAFEQNVPVDYIKFNSEELRGLYINGSIALRREMDSVTTADTLAEELGHHYTTVGDILDQTNVSNRKQERLARVWAYNRRIGLTGIIQGYRAHCRSCYELAEYLDVSEDFLREALDCYREKYGVYTELDGYVIYFEPCLIVMETLR